MLKKQASTRLGLESPEAQGGAMTGPTIAGCQYEKRQQQLVLSFNTTLLGETGGMLDRFVRVHSCHACRTRIG